MDEEIIRILIKKGNEFLKSRKKDIHFLDDEEANKLINDLKNYPHAFVLACLLNRGVKDKIVWAIPYKISSLIGGFEFEKLSKLSEKEIYNLFVKNNLHRYKEKMAEVFFKGVQLLKEKYNGNASEIWKNNPSSALVVRRFLEFHGVGVKIATMSVNILARDFKIKMRDKYCIDISPDVHVRRVLQRIGFIDNDDVNEMIYLARELNFEYPGIFDLPLWNIGKNWCRPKNPNCQECYLKKECPKIMK